ncbi:MAG: hypothetical protein VYB63_07130, partial [Chloroflexota bacterium]|nr:hypothetical protein [Chloroflexota bacterium]
MGGLKKLGALVLTALFVVSCGSDADRITFVSEVDGDPEIYVVDPESGDATPLTDNRSADSSPVWSPDGK